MSLRLLYDRTVTLQPMNVAAEDSTGTVVLGPGVPVEGVAAMRERVDTSEQLDSRDRQTVRWDYLIPPTVDAMHLTGNDRIVDQGVTFEIIGAPEIVRRRWGHVGVLARCAEVTG